MPAAGEIRPRGALGRIALALAFACLGTHAFSGELDVVVHDGQIDVSAQAVPLSQIVERIAATIGAEVEYLGPPPLQAVTLALVGRSPAEAFAGVLEANGANHALQMDEAGTGIVRVVVVTASSPPDQESLAPLASQQVEVPPPPLPEVLERLIEEAAEEGEPVGADGDEEQVEAPALPEVLEELIRQRPDEGEKPLEGRDEDQP